MKELYLDNSATTQVSPEIVEAMQKSMLENYGNPSSLHEKGDQAQALINKAKEKLSKEINCKPWEIYFTSGGTESDNWAIKGLAKKNPEKKKIIISAIEHAAILETSSSLKKQGFQIIKIPVDKLGFINLSSLEKALKNPKDILIVSIIHANNIIGTIQNLDKIGDICQKAGVPFHTDAVQSFGKIPIDVNKSNLSLLSASAHKLGGPKGIGFLYIKEGINISPLIHGGGQEKGLRSGTENVPGIVGFAKALELSKNTDKLVVGNLRDKLINKLLKIGGKINGPINENRLFNNIHISFPGIENDSLVIALSEKGIFVSAGSACDSKKDKEDHVLNALCIDDKYIKGSIRISLKEKLSNNDIERIVNNIKYYIHNNDR